MQNLALNRPATQSSTSKWSTNQGRDVDARVANDGVINGSRWFHTGKEPNPWWQVDLGDTFFIAKVVIYNRPDLRGRLTNFYIKISHDGKSWLEVAERRDVGEFDEITIDLEASSIASFVRIELIGFGCLHFRECQVFGSECGADERQKLIARDQKKLELIENKLKIPHGRAGEVVRVGRFYIFNDEKYYQRIQDALDEGYYERRERKLVEMFLSPSDRVMEIGTGIGAVTMTAAGIVGQHNVMTFDANPYIVRDAKENFQRNGFDCIISNTGVLQNRAGFRPAGQIEFYVSRGFCASRLFPGKDSSDIVETIKVPVFCLEDELEKFQANVMLCDIEGGEVDLLSGADLRGVKLIIMETHYWAVGEKKTDEMMRYLISIGFSLHLGESGNHACVLRRASAAQC
jgi:FkbM family methyltransferase